MSEPKCPWVSRLRAGLAGATPRVSARLRATEIAEHPVHPSSTASCGAVRYRVPCRSGAETAGRSGQFDPLPASSSRTRARTPRPTLSTQPASPRADRRGETTLPAPGWTLVAGIDCATLPQHGRSSPHGTVAPSAKPPTGTDGLQRGDSTASCIAITGPNRRVDFHCHWQARRTMTQRCRGTVRQIVVSLESGEVCRLHTGYSSPILPDIH